ncbi:hypothetical protein ISN44_As09g012670 [Arabidopsis suecica]|uniref:Secreted protein n=1 Tax=Arabidopsis suecica TaxID=45249 RepID=A0A8T2ALM0_ARASU|nr:hypothetical protein ISN44_As09g012670 [Arabidopsis suecica]
MLFTANSFLYCVASVEGSVVRENQSPVAVPSASTSTASRRSVLDFLLPGGPGCEFRVPRLCRGCFSSYRFHFFQVFLGLSAACRCVSARDLSYSVAGFTLRTTSSITSEASILSFSSSSLVSGDPRLSWLFLLKESSRTFRSVSPLFLAVGLCLRGASKANGFWCGGEWFLSSSALLTSGNELGPLKQSRKAGQASTDKMNQILIEFNFSIIRGSLSPHLPITLRSSWFVAIR